MTYQQQHLLDSLTEAGWELAAQETIDDWWADDVWRMRSVWSPHDRKFYLTFLVDPQLDLNRKRRQGEGTWAVSASVELPTSRPLGSDGIIFSLGHGWEKRLGGFVEEVSRFRDIAP